MMPAPPVLAGLHTDVAPYLARSPLRTIDDKGFLFSRSSYQAAGFVFDTFVVFAETGAGSTKECRDQIKVLQTLIDLPGELHVKQLVDNTPLTTAKWDILYWRPAIENAAALGEADDSFTAIRKNLESFIGALGKPLYLTLAYDLPSGEPNRFLGGNRTEDLGLGPKGRGIGLTADGSRLLDLLAEFSIPVDLSHASSFAMDELLTECDNRRIPLIASHSLFRAVHPHSRNLPDEVAVEISRRGGLVGINAIGNFVGGDKDLACLMRHVSHGIKLGISHSLALGLDFYHLPDNQFLLDIYGNDISAPFITGVKSLSEAARVVEATEKQCGAETAKAIACGNVLAFLSGR